MIELKKDDLNGKSAVNLVRLIIASNPQAVRNNVKKDFGIDVSRYTDNQIADFLLKILASGKSVNRTLNVAPMRGFSFIYEGQTVTPNPSSQEAGKFNLGDTLSDVGNVLLGVAGTVLAGSALGNVLFPTQPQTPPVNNTNSTTNNNNMELSMWERFKNHVSENKTTYIVGGTILIIISVVLYNTYGGGAKKSK